MSITPGPQPEDSYRDVVRPRALPRALALGAALLLALGAGAFAYGLVTDPRSAWLAFHVNYLYFAGIAQGGLVLACALTIVGARWAGPVRRIAESLAAWAPVTFVLAAVDCFLGGAYIYPWRHDYHGVAEALPWKEAWLNPARLASVDLAIFALLALLSVWYLHASLRPAIKAGLTGSGENEIARSRKTTRVLAPIICLAYAFGYSFIGFDQVMSLEPTWFSNLFGGYFAWGAFLSAISVTALLTVLHKNAPGFEGAVTRARLHDLGKMIFAFSIFWMYLFFSQYIVIWYGNLPEETQYFKDRLGTEFLMSTWYWEGWWERIWGEPWVRVTLFTWMCVWLVPFWTLLGQRPKQSAPFMGGIALLSAFGFWLERNVLVWPSIFPNDTWAWLGGVQLGVAGGFLGAFTLVWLVYARVWPSLAVPKEG